MLAQFSDDFHKITSHSGAISIIYTVTACWRLPPTLQRLFGDMHMPTTSERKRERCRGVAFRPRVETEAHRSRDRAPATPVAGGIGTSARDWCGTIKLLLHCARVKLYLVTAAAAFDYRSTAVCLKQKLFFFVNHSKCHPKMVTKWEINDEFVVRIWLRPRTDERRVVNLNPTFKPLRNNITTLGKVVQ